MKKGLLALVLLTLGSSAYASEYKCWRYVDNKPTGGWIVVTADSKSEAQDKARAEYSRLGYSFDYLECEYK